MKLTGKVTAFTLDSLKFGEPEVPYVTITLNEAPGMYKTFKMLADGSLQLGTEVEIVVMVKQMERPFSVMEAEKVRITEAPDETTGGLAKEWEERVGPQLVGKGDKDAS